MTKDQESEISHLENLESKFPWQRRGLLVIWKVEFGDIGAQELRITIRRVELFVFLHKVLHEVNSDHVLGLLSENAGEASGQAEWSQCQLND